MNKSGKILLLEPDSEICGTVCDKLTAIAGKNEVLCFSDIEAATQYITTNVSDVFVVLQNFTSPGMQLPDSRNMVYMHEKFNVDSIAYMFLVQSKEETLEDGLHTFIHCYYKPLDVHKLLKVFEDIIDFWKDHVFPSRLSRKNYSKL